MSTCDVCMRDVDDGVACGDWQPDYSDLESQLASLRADLSRVTAERDGKQQMIDLAIKRGNDFADGLIAAVEATERDTAEAIAAWLESYYDLYPTQRKVLVENIRAHAWRTR